MEIREADMSDALAIARVAVDTWKTAYRGLLPDKQLDGMTYEEKRKNFKYLVSREKCFVYVVENEAGQVIGFAAAGPERFLNIHYQGELYAIYVLKEYQRCGAGHLLFSHVVMRFIQQGIYSMMVWVLEGNPYSKFYENNGGKEIYSKNVDIDGYQAPMIACGWHDIRNLVPESTN